MALRWLCRDHMAIYLILGVGTLVLGGLLLNWFSPVEERKRSPIQHWTADTTSSSPISSSRRLVGYWGTGPSGDVAVDGHIAYVSSGTSLEIVGVSDPKRPLHIGRTSSPGPVVDVVLEGEYAYVVTNHIPIAGAPHETKEFGLAVVDVSDPTAPKEIGVFETSGVAQEVAVTSDFAFIVDRGNGLRVVDVSDPSSLREVAFFGPSSNASAIAVSEDLAYLADGPEGLRVIDTTSPSINLYELGRYNPNGHVRGVTVNGDYAFVTVRSCPASNSSTAGVRVVDITDPRSPQEVGTFQLSGRTWDLTIAGDRAYVSVRGALQVFDISNLPDPTPIDTFKTGVPGFGADGSVAPIMGEVVVSGRYAYLASHRYPRGLYVIELADKE